LLSYGADVHPGSENTSAHLYAIYLLMETTHPQIKWFAKQKRKGAVEN